MGLTVYQILSLVGISGLLGAFYKMVGKRISENEDKTRAVQLGVQALLRDRMIQCYNHYADDKGYAPIYAKQNFENMWKQYHSLGANGVMDDVHLKFMALPTESKD